ncbi:MAG: DUF3800 domain-containing protein [Planctomycetes bacterium]|nr:DUF3800 domain-containing protein [Planctomycetota bacterium]
MIARLVGPTIWLVEGCPQPVAFFLGRAVYLFYVDESGDPHGWESQDNFVLGGVAVHEGQVRRLCAELDAVQKAFFPGIAVPFEFHAQRIHSGKDRFRAMSQERRTELLNTAYDVIARAGFPNLVGFISAIHVSAVTSPHQALSDCLGDICQRFNTFLVRQYSAGHPDKGLLIMDESGREPRVRELMAEFDQRGTRWGYLGNIIDVPYFADSKHTRPLQLADLLAFAASRYFSSNDDTFLQRVLGRIDRRGPTGDRVGLKHLIGADHHCSCMAIH